MARATVMPVPTPLRLPATSFLLPIGYPEQRGSQVKKRLEIELLHPAMVQTLFRLTSPDDG
ncbi:hypothetical protein EAO27_14530 [Sphingopyxis sp. YF1]|jgi:hypothetical protein|nr:hypothetical protein EAO27_14530 [Sphingopyxis sp. YF1]